MDLIENKKYELDKLNNKRILISEKYFSEIKNPKIKFLDFNRFFNI